MTQLTENVFAVEVPEGADGFDFNIVNDHYELTYYTMEDEEKELHGIQIPDGNWQLLCTTREATEEIAASIVQIISNGKISGMPQYRRYDRDLTKEMPARCWTRDSRHALETLLTSKGLDVNKNYVLLKKG